MRGIVLLGPLLFAAAAAPFTRTHADPPPGKAPARERGTVILTDEARKIHQDALLIDGHNDLPWQYRSKDDLSFRRIDITRPQPDLHTDIPRLKKGNVGAQFWAAYVPSSSGRKGTALRETVEQIDVIHRMVKAHPDVFAFAATAEDIPRLRKEGKIASMIGVEGGHSIDGSLGALRVFHTLGVRYMTLTHSESLEWADSATDKPRANGLSPFGESVVREMNRLGMLVDLSHVSAETMRHALRVARAPVIFSHSSAFTLVDHPRNVPDDVLRGLKKNGGVVCINFYPGFVVPEAARASRQREAVQRDLKKKYPDEKQRQEAYAAWRKENPTPSGSIHHVVDHLEHAIRTAGVDHVGIGSDYDGIDAVPRQLEDVASYPLLTQELLNRGHKADDIRKVLGLNVLRVLREAERVAREWK